MIATPSLVFVCSLFAPMPADTRIELLEALPTAPAMRHAVASRPPLAPVPLAKLPVGSIAPRGWLRHQLEREAEGFVGRLAELSKFCAPDNGWLTGKGPGWEEAPYWLKGLVDLGYVLKNERVTAEARKYLDAILTSQRSDGWFGPEENRKILDLWPNMIVLFALRSHAEATGDPRVVPFMTRYFAFERTIPDDALFPAGGHPLCWQKWRGGDNLESVYWLYERTGEAALLDLASRLHARTADWTNGIPTWHGVNITMGIREPGTYFRQSHDPAHLAAVERNYRTVMEKYGRQPGGMFAADENCREGKDDPRQAAETCSMVEFMHSFESMLKITGDATWADRAEEIALNSLPASMTPDLDGLRYLTAANMPIADRDPEKKSEYENRGEMASYNPWSYRCCQHNAAFGWPYFAEHLVLATAGDGLAAAFYAPCEVEATVGDGAKVRVVEETDYPFGDRVRFTVLTEKPARFALTLRIPAWCDAPAVIVDGATKPVRGANGERWVRVERTWNDGESLELVLPMTVGVTTWPTMKSAASVRRGPLWYSLRIGEKWTRYAGTDEWPAHEVFATTPWNYALVLDPAAPAASLEVVPRGGPLAAQPFVSDEGAPIALRARARRVPGWTIENGTWGLLPQSPVATSEPVETVTLVPMGGARLRITSFPVAERAVD